MYTSISLLFDLESSLLTFPHFSTPTINRDNSNIPLQTFKAKEPHIGKVVSTKRIVGAQATGETCNIIIDHGGKM